VVSGKFIILTTHHSPLTTHQERGDIDQQNYGVNGDPGH
jgi:hypothetical protein